jgi:hypothetical protein
MVVAFGGLFSHLFLRTFDSSGKTVKIINLPIAFASKEKFLVRLQQDPSLQEDVQISLPRLSFEILGFDYDSSKQLNKNQRIQSIKNGRSVIQYAPVPYNITFNLYSFTRTQEDNLQILEQIVPYFTPDINLAIKVMQNPDLTQDCALILNSVNIDDQYDGSFEDRRYIITTYSFTLQTAYFGPLLGTNDPENHFENGREASVIKKVITNVNNMKYTAVIDPFLANSDDIYSIDEGWSERTPETDFDTNITL